MNRVQVDFKALPAHILENTVAAGTFQNIRSPENVLTPLTFPKSKVALWDPSPKDEEGVTITLDRFDPGREQKGSPVKAPTALLPGDILVPCVFEARPATGNTVHSREDLNILFKMLEHSCCSREVLELSKLLSLRARLSCSENMDRLSFDLSWAAVTPACALDTVPIRAVPIIPTALARNLISSPGLSQNSRKRGFLTMDQTRKLLLMLESDPKAYTLPLVGIWLSGVTHIYNPLVWAWSLRYLHSSSLQDKVLMEGGCFLVVLYSLTHRDPEFYQCKPGLGVQQLSFQLLTNTESLVLYKNVEPIEGKHLQFELSAENQNQETALFEEVHSHSKLTRMSLEAPSAVSLNKLSVSDQDSGVEDEELSPRPSPNPHPVTQQTKRVHPSVPELSVLFDGSFLDGNVVDTPGSVTHSSVQHSNSSPLNPLRASEHGYNLGPPPIRRPLTPIISQGKNKLHSNQELQTPQPPSTRKSLPSMRSREGSSSSSSSSSTKNASPNGSFHNQRHRSSLGASTRRHLVCSAPPTKSQPIPNQTPIPHPSQQKIFHSTPAANPCNCCTNQPNHVPLYQSNGWQGTPGYPNPCAFHCISDTNHCHSPSRQSLGCCMSPTKSPICHSTVQAHNSPSAAPSVPLENPNKGLVEQASSGQAQCCQVQASHVPNSDTPMGVLPADAYRMLIDQERQLKLLQLQIQKLLESQNKLPQVSSDSKRSSVSVAVGTGASLFWGGPQEDLTPEAQKLDWQTNVEPKSGCQNASPLSSRHGSESVYSCSKERSTGSPQLPASPQHNTSTGLGAQSFQSPVLGESASMYYQSQSQLEGQPENGVIDDPRFYQELLGQVQNRLQDSGEVKVDQGQEDVPKRQSLSLLEYQSKKLPAVHPNLKQGSSPPNQDRVLSATLRQLQQFGVNVDLDSAQGKTTRATVESASTLACINPDAVIPRLALSEPIGTSIWAPSGSVDLSLEANAIALKYLSDSQLSRLSLGGNSSSSRPDPSSILLRTPAEKSTVGLSILSPSNMSLATCKYMKKYGLMDGENSSEEEQEDPVLVDSALGCSVQHETSKNMTPDPEQSNAILKNITNKPLADFHTCPSDSQEQLIQNLRPKMLLLNRRVANPEKENDSKGGQTQRRSLQMENLKMQEVTEPQGSVGNFLDLSRLRQLPKLF
ncbi:hypothetical protein DNTS_027937 [Danionella cerebrum]|uniref:SCL-interrupting locus protein homolog n=1 Tax=Danionella cerebrum TaxID=2873325 RepID=A0A553QWP3_9TELE|nr:hypothetical protein DNTS_027937 [Danionella translucida]